MDLILKHLETLDITEEEAAVYINALESGASTVLEYAQNTGIPRTTVYLLVDSLIEKGLISEHIEGKKKKYIPATPKELVLLAERKQEQYKQTAKALETDLNELQALYNLKIGKPKVSYVEGTNELKKIFEASFMSDKIYIHFMSQEGHDLLEKEREEYFDKLITKMRTTYQILTKNSANVEFKEKNDTSRNQILCLDKEFSSSVDYLLYNDSIVYFTYKENQPSALIIEDKAIAYFEKTRFQLIWKMAQELSAKNTIQ